MFSTPRAPAEVAQPLGYFLTRRQVKIAAALLVSVIVSLPVVALASQAPQRVISTDAAITEIVIALGAGDRLVGVDDTRGLLPEQASLPRLGYHRALSAEGLLSLQPDQVLVSEHAGPARALQPLASAAVPVLRLPAAQHMHGLRSNIRLIAAALALPQEGESLVARLELQAAAIEAQHFATPPYAVLLRESNGELRVAGQGSAGQALLTLLGAKNAVDYPGYRSFTAEGLLALNPQWLIVVEDIPTSPDQWLSRFPLLAYSRAAQDRAVITVNSRALVGGLSLSALSEAERLLAGMTPRQQGAVP